MTETVPATLGAAESHSDANPGQAPTFAQILAALQARYPSCFPPKGNDPKPLKIRIHKDLLARDLPEGV